MVETTTSPVIVEPNVGQVRLQRVAWLALVGLQVFYLILDARDGTGPLFVLRLGVVLLLVAVGLWQLRPIRSPLVVLNDRGLEGPDAGGLVPWSNVRDIRFNWPTGGVWVELRDPDAHLRGADPSWRRWHPRVRWDHGFSIGRWTLTRSEQRAVVAATDRWRRIPREAAPRAKLFG